MPGIFGILGRGSSAKRSMELQTMKSRMSAERFCLSGSYEIPELGVWVGWQSAEAPGRPLPLWNETGDVCLVLTGEAFPEETELHALKNRGHQFSLENGCYLVHAYEEAGRGFLGDLNGCCSGLVIDRRKGEVLLFNDRFGLSRIYLHENAEGFYFASEAKCLMSVQPKLRCLDPEGLAEFCTCGCVLGNRTLFKGISLLPPASGWRFRQGEAAQKEVYFRKETWEHQAPLSRLEYQEKAKAIFSRALAKYLRGNGQVAMSLTGGLDGRLIMAWAGRAVGSLPCYTFGSEYRDCADLKVARKVARICDQSHTTIRAGQEFLKDFPNLAEKAVWVSDGAMDVTGSVNLFINRLARQIAPVRLTGNYGSEILRGCVAFKPHALNEALYEPELSRLGKAAAATYAREAQGRRLSFIAFKQVPWHHYACLAVEQSQITVRSPFLDNEVVKLAYQAPQEVPLTAEQTLSLIESCNPALSRIATDRGLCYPTIPVLGGVHRLYQEFTSKAEYAFDAGMPQWLARFNHHLRPLHLESLFLGRHKFCHFRVWFRDQLSSYIQSLLLDSRTLGRPYLRPAAVEKMVRGHVSGLANHTDEIQQVLTLELIQRKLIEGN